MTRRHRAVVDQVAPVPQLRGIDDDDVHGILLDGHGDCPTLPNSIPLGVCGYKVDSRDVSHGSACW